MGDPSSGRLHAWVCGSCRKIVEVVSVEPELPAGWQWQPYLSYRLCPLQPGRVDLALGCCELHALHAAEMLGIPVETVPVDLNLDGRAAPEVRHVP